MKYKKLVYKLAFEGVDMESRVLTMRAHSSNGDTHLLRMKIGDMISVDYFIDLDFPNKSSKHLASWKILLDMLGFEVIS